jgi:hypothetical protein
MKYLQIRFAHLPGLQKEVKDNIDDANGSTEDCNPVVVLEGRCEDGGDYRIDGNHTVFGADRAKHAVDIPVTRIPYDVHKDFTDEEIEKLINLLSNQKEFCFDTETDNIEARHANLVGISFCFQEKEAYYVPIPDEKDLSKSRVHLFSKVLLNPNIIKIGHNLKYDLKVLDRYGIHIPSSCFDTMIAHYLINPESKQSMD